MAPHDALNLYECGTAAEGPKKFNLAAQFMSMIAHHGGLAIAEKSHKELRFKLS